MKQAITALVGSAITTLMVLVGIVLNHRGMDRLCVRVANLEKSLCEEMRAMRDRIHSDMMLRSSGAAVSAKSEN